ncbi:MAG: CHAT domain-containing protein [Acidobacteria bacterium]|nr:CHAT domain-containing protein [Acidobacteriota bacterium]
MAQGILQRQFPKRAGRVLPLSRYFSFFFLLCFTVLVLPSTSQAGQQTETVQTEEELITALVKIGNHQQPSIRTLIQQHQSLVTKRLWEKLIAKAADSYYDKGADHSLALYDIALAVADHLKDARLLASTHYNIGRTYSGLGKTTEAIRSCLESKRLFESVGARRDLIYVLSDIGALYLYARDYKQAKSYSEQSLAMAEAVKNLSEPVGVLPDQYGVAGALSTLATLFSQDGNYSQAIEYLQKSTTLYQELGAVRYGFQQAENLAELGRVHKAMGDNVQALLFLNKAFQTARKLPYHDLTARIINSIGLLYLEQEDYAKALGFFGQSLEAYKRSSNQAEAALVLQNVGVTHQRQGNFDQALESFRKSIEQMEESDKDVLIAARQGMGAVYREKGEFKAAMEVLDLGLSLAEQVGDQTRIAEILWRKAEVHHDLRNYADAVALSEDALKIARKLGLPKLSYLTATTLGKAYIKQKKTDLALNTLAQAVEQVETMRERVTGQEQGRLLFFEKKVAAYHALIELLIEQNKLTEALMYTERAKGRVLLDILSGGRFRSASVMTPSEKKEERQLNQAIIAINNEIRQERLKKSADPAQLEQLNARLDAARLKYASFQDVFHAAHPEWKTLPGQIGALKPDGLSRLVPNQKTALLDYVVTKERCYLFLLSNQSPSRSFDLKVYPINIVEKDLKRMVDRFRQMLASRHPDFAEPSRELYDLLIKPAESQLLGISTIGIVPDGVLWELPFQALQARENHYLIEDSSIFFSPSLRVLRELDGRRGVGDRQISLLAFANPLTEANSPIGLQETRNGERLVALPDAETEVRSLTQFFAANRSDIFIGANADEKTFKSQAATHSIIHCATHGVLDNNHPLYSYLLFSNADGDGENDGLLEAREILNLELNADLVVLSACETARGRVGAGEGMIGMSWAFFAAGCRAAVVSQWKVNSASTADWMTGFYQELRQTKDEKKIVKADALRLAMLKMMKDRRYGHPFYWAGFVLIGSDD